MLLSPPEILSLMVSDLCGVDVPSSDIEWAMDLPAGKTLIEWLASQMCIEKNDEGRDLDKSDRQSCVEGIVLENEEVCK